MNNSLPSVLSGIFKKPFAEQVAFFRGKLGKLVPTKRWDDISKAAHDVSFMVAGAEKADLLADLAMAVDRAIAEGTGGAAFRKDFHAIVQQRGWHGWTGESTRAGRNWRTRVIYQTNMATSYAAARVAQLRQGGFKFWVYRHNDSVTHPRPLHQSWNGITRPADDPFWQTHGTPNGWGCRCYILGARSDAGARRLGGDPNKPLNPAWKKIDPKTGAPVGIDKGWDYLPGDTVSDTVNAMARKTQQWEYTLAKAYMQDVPATVRDDLARAYRDLPSLADDVRRYAQASLAKKKVAKYRTMGLLTAADAKQVNKINGSGDVSGFDFALDKNLPIHAFNRHGTLATEAPQGQRPVTLKDYAQLPLVLNSYDRIEKDTQKKTGQIVFLFIKVIGGERFTASFVIQTGRQMVAMKSLRIKKTP